MSGHKSTIGNKRNTMPLGGFGDVSQPPELINHLCDCFSCPVCAGLAWNPVESKKGHKVLDSLCGVVKGYKMCFNSPGLSKVEPAFANAVKSTKEDSIHGVAIKLAPEDMSKLDAQEKNYKLLGMKK